MAGVVQFVDGFLQGFCPDFIMGIDHCGEVLL